MTAAAVDRDLPAATVFAHALAGEECHLLVGPPSGPRPHHQVRLPVEDWTRLANEADRAILALCVGPTIDVGCGPGRLTAALAASGQGTLGIDVVPEAVAEARVRGGAALRRDVFGEIPGEGLWETALLADGNIGIGGDPIALLSRLRCLVAVGGRIVVDVAGPGVRSESMSASLCCDCATSTPFRWAIVGVDDMPRIAQEAGLRIHSAGNFHSRWWVVLEDHT